MAFRAEGDYFVLLNNFQKKLYVIRIPRSTAINYQNSHDYTLDAIWQLGKIDKNKKSSYMRAMQSLFGYPIRVLYENEKINLDSFDIKMTDIFAGRTNLNIFDYFLIKSKRYKVIKQSLSDHVRPRIFKIKDETRLQFSEKQIDNELKNIFEDVELSNLGYRVQIKVLSAGETQKDEISRIIDNIGWKLANVEYVDRGTNKNQCILKTSNNSEELIKNMFECSIIVQDKSLYDLVIVVGQKLEN